MLASVPKVSHHSLGSDGFHGHLEPATLAREMMGAGLGVGSGVQLPDHERRAGGGRSPLPQNGFITGK